MCVFLMRMILSCIWFQAGSENQKKPAEKAANRWHKRRRTADQHSLSERVCLEKLFIFRCLSLKDFFFPSFFNIDLLHVLFVYLEQNRRTRIQEKLKTLQQMVPNTSQVSSFLFCLYI